MHTVTPQGISDYVLEVATIQAPYVIRLGAVRNTRFITTTKTKTRLVTRTPEPELLPAIEALLDDRYVDEQQDYPQYQDEPGFDGDVIDENQEPEILHPDPSLPLAENILATTAPYENILKVSLRYGTKSLYLRKENFSYGSKSAMPQTHRQTILFYLSSD